MDERLEIWIARDPETNEESKAVSLRKLRKGVRIGRLKTETLVKRIDASEWVTLERLLADAEVVLSKTPPPVQAHAPMAPPRPAPAPKGEALPSIVVSPSAIPPPLRPRADSTGEITEVEEILPGPAPVPSVEAEPAPAQDVDTALTTQWFTQSVLPPEPDDDVPVFPTRSLLDLGFEQVMTTRFVRLVWVLLLASCGLGVVAAVVRAIASIATGDSTQAATAVATVPVIVLAAVVVAAIGRMLLEVLLAVFRIADRLTALSKSVAR